MKQRAEILRALMKEKNMKVSGIAKERRCIIGIKH